MGYTYSQISLNINKKQIVVNEGKYHETISNLDNIIKKNNDMSDTEIARVIKSLLEIEFKEYIDNYIPSYPREMRQIYLGNMLEDSFAYLIMNGLVNYNKPYLNIFNFAENLDILLAIAFDIPIYEATEKISELCKKKGITSKCLSLVTTLGDGEGDVGVTVGDLCSLSPKIKDFFEDIVSNKIQSNIPMIDSAVQGEKYSGIIEEPNVLNPTASFRLKLYSALVNPIKKLITDFYDYRGKRKDIVYSQFISGVVFNTEMPIEKYTFMYKGFNQEFYLPHEVMKVR